MLLSFFVTCVVCVFGINQVLLELCKAESQFLVPWRVNTGTMFNFVLKSSVEKCNRVVPLLVQRHRQIVVLSRRKKDERLQRACCSPGEEVESPEFSESLWSTLLFRPRSPQKTVNLKLISKKSFLWQDFT